MVYWTNDSPGTGNPGGNAPVNLTDIIDVRKVYRMYFAVSYADGSVYAVSNLDWTFNAWGDRSAVPVGPKLRDTRGVRLNSVRVHDNEDPWTAAPWVAGTAYDWLENRPNP